MLFLFAFTGAAASSRAQTPAADPDAPAPEASIKLRIPHSQRTKENILDSVLDFAFVQFLSCLKTQKFHMTFLK